MPDSYHDKLRRVRPPRVQIRYDVETGGAMKKVELPYVVGVLADLSGQRKEPLPALRQRRFAEIDRDNFHDVLAKSAPRLALRVDNKLANDGSQLNVELNFKHLDDFKPDELAKQVPALRALLKQREDLKTLSAKMDGNDKLEQLLEEILKNSEKAAALAKHLGVDGTAPAAEDAK